MSVLWSYVFCETFIRFIEAEILLGVQLDLIGKFYKMGFVVTVTQKSWPERVYTKVFTDFYSKISIVYRKF